MRISIRARNFCSSLNCLRDGSRDNKKHLPSSTSVLPIFSVAKFAVVAPGRKFCFASFVEHFEAVPCLLLVNCLLPLHPHCFEYLNYFAFRGLEGEVEGIIVRRSTDI